MELRKGMLDLRAHAHTAVQALSGGLKRRLSVALALTGDPRLLILDEPTSGMDATSRRALWSTLEACRPGRVVVVSTHSMEEADAIGDRIAILVDGAVKATGRPLQLKAKYGLGYRLHCVLSTSAGEERAPRQEALRRLEAGVKLHAPSAKMVCVSPTEVVVELGLSGAGDGVMAALLRRLDDSLLSHALGIKSYGLTCASLEHVYLSICDNQTHPSLRADVCQKEHQEDGCLHSLECEREASAVQVKCEHTSAGALNGDDAEALQDASHPQPSAPGLLQPGNGQPARTAMVFAGMPMLGALVWKLWVVRARGRRAMAYFVLYPMVVIVATFTLFSSAFFSLGSQAMLTGARLRVRGLSPLPVAAHGAPLLVVNRSGVDLDAFLHALTHQGLNPVLAPSQTEYLSALGMLTTVPQAKRGARAWVHEGCGAPCAPGVLGGLEVASYLPGAAGASPSIALTLMFNSSAPLTAAALQRAVLDAALAQSGPAETRLAVRLWVCFRVTLSLAYHLCCCIAA